LGVDIAGFTSESGFQDVWDNYQCKRYDHPLRPSDIWVELGKIIYYSFKKEYLPPRQHFSVASQGIGTSLEQLLNKPNTLKAKTRENWEKHCEKGITSTEEIPLTGALQAHFDAFDFSIFTSKAHVELIEGHSTTGYHAVRFGGGLPPRPDPDKPPTTPEATESRYIRQILNAYPPPYWRDGGQRVRPREMPHKKCFGHGKKAVHANDEDDGKRSARAYRAQWPCEK
jgi:hypothetical protein